MNPSNPNHLPKALPSNIITLRFRALTCKFEGWVNTAQSRIATLYLLNVFVLASFEVQKSEIVSQPLAC